MSRPRYRYRVVTSCGAGVHTKERTFPKALRALAKYLGRRFYEDAEIERVLAVDDGHTYQYWLWRGGRWRVYPDRAFEPTDEDYAYWRERAEALS